MKEFDFEELDRAVSSALTPNEPGKGSDVPEAPVTTPEPLPSQTPLPSPVPARTETPSPAARRSSGRFMDVMHPSADMRTSARPTVPVSTAPEVPIEKPAVIQPEATQAINEAAPQDSPFIPDAVVEKRPLGAPLEQELLEGVEDTPLLEATVEAQPQPDVEPDTAPSVAMAESHSMSIASEPAATTVYDAEISHPPMGALPKKRSGLWVVLWIVLLAILGAAVGAGVYFYVLPQL